MLSLTVLSVRAEPEGMISFIRRRGAFLHRTRPCWISCKPRVVKPPQAVASAAANRFGFYNILLHYYYYYYSRPNKPKRQRRKRQRGETSSRARAGRNNKRDERERGGDGQVSLSTISTRDGSCADRGPVCRKTAFDFAGVKDVCVCVFVFKTEFFPSARAKFR